MDSHPRAHPFRMAAIALVAALTGCASANTPNQTVSDSTRLRLAEALQAAGDTANAAAIMQGQPLQRAAPPADPLAQATGLIAAGQVDQGITAAKAALAARGDDLPFALEVGRLAMKSGRLADAGDVYQQILWRHPDSVEALNGKGVVLAQQGDLSGAADVLRQALAHHPQDVPTRNNLALVMALSGETDVALSMLQDLDRTDGSPQVKATLALTRERLRLNGAAQAAAVPAQPPQ